MPRQKNRVEVNQDLGGPAPLKPQAGAGGLRDAFTFAGQVQYGRPDSSALFNLAQSLSSIEPRLNQAVNNLVQGKVIQTEMQQREAAQLAEEMALKSQEDFKNFVKNNPDMAGANPWLPVYVEKVAARHAANQFDQHIRTLYSISDIRNSNDPDAFDKFYNEELQKFMSERGLTFGTRAMTQDMVPRIEASKQTLRNYHIQQQMAANIETAEAALGQQAQSIVESQYERVLQESSSKTLELDNIQELADILTQVGKEAVQFGLSGHEGHRVNTAISSAVIRVAEERGDEEILKVLDHIKTGSGTLGDIPSVSEAAVRARRNIRNENWTQEQRSLSQLEYQKKQVNNILYSQTVDALLRDKDADITQNIQTLLSLNMGKEAEQLLDLQFKLQKQSVEIVEDPQLAAALIAKAYISTSSEEVLEVLKTAIDELSKASPKISPTTVSQIAAIQSSISQREENKSGRFIDPDFKDAIERHIIDQTKPDKLATLAKDNSSKALREFYSRLLDRTRQRREELGRPLTAAETEEVWEQTADETIEKYQRMSKRTTSQTQSQPNKPQPKPQTPAPPPPPPSSVEKRRQEIIRDLDALEKMLN